MALFRRRKNDGPDWVTDLPGASRIERKFHQALIRQYLGAMKIAQLQGAQLVQPGTWEGVATLAQLHNVNVKGAVRDTPGVDLLRPGVQSAIGIALDQFAGHYGVRGSLVRAWGTADALNRRFETAWHPSELNRFDWWADQSVAFACILHPLEEGAPVIDGLLLFDHTTYEFTPDSEAQEQVLWDRSKVSNVEDPVNRATVLHLDRAVGYSRADIASKARIQLETASGPVFSDTSTPQPRSKPRRNWGSLG
ncbi:hypothetical protein ACWEPZ_26570 [Streptomyces sp. NPDC004288]